MNPRIQELLVALRRTAARYRPWVVLIAATASALAITTVVRLDALRQAAEGERRRAELAREVEAARAWLARFEPPTPAESAGWRRSAAEVAALSGSNPDRLAVARLVVERARAAGIRVVRVNFLLPDSLDEAPPPVAGEAGVSLADWVLLLEADARLAELARFLDNLPPGLALWRLEVRREDSRGRATLRLLSYTLSEQSSEGGEEPSKEGLR